MPLGVSAWLRKWGNVLVSPASTDSPVGNEAAPAVRSLPRRRSYLLLNTPLAANAVFTSAWFDAQAAGAAVVSLTFLANQATSSAIVIQGTDDPSNSSLLFNIGSNGGGVAASTLTQVVAVLKYRYWRVTFTNGATLQGSVAVWITEESEPNIVLMAGQSTITNGAAFIPVVSGLGNLAIQASAGNTNGDGLAAGAWAQSSAFTQSMCMQLTYLTSGATSGNTVGARTPQVYRGVQLSTGNTPLWTPPSTKKVRLMKYMIEVAEDATITSGPLPINIAFTQRLGTATTLKLSYPGYAFTHRLVLPATVIATSFDGYLSGLVDLGNGVLTDNAGAALLVGIQIPQSTGAITSPSWTLPTTAQWEAATVGYKSDGARGNFKLIQQNSIANTTATLVFTAVQSIAGSTAYVFFRTTNAAGGAPTIAVTDTAGNTYTTGTLITNASDPGGGGSSIGVAVCTNMLGNAANVVTITGTTNVPTQMCGVYLEYAGMGAGGGIDAAQVGTTGSSTTPASGAYTPATAGDLVFTFCGTSTSEASQPTAPTNFLLRGSIFLPTQGCLQVADNFGNGTLAAGVVNVIAMGTEE